jgi:hypothetical protein
MKQNPTLSEIIHFIAEKSGEDIERIQADTDIADFGGLYGLDWHSFMEEYAKQFEVNMENYLWYFHTGTEGIPFLRKWYEIIPVTPMMLQDFANKGFWDMKYPPHPEPEYYYKKGYDYDCLAIFSLTIAFFCWLIYALIDWIW